MGCPVRGKGHIQSIQSLIFAVLTGAASSWMTKPLFIKHMVTDFDQISLYYMKIQLHSLDCALTLCL